MRKVIDNHIHRYPFSWSHKNVLPLEKLGKALAKNYKKLANC